MRSGLIILGGVVLWALCLGATQLAAGLNARTVGVVTLLFAGLWLCAAGLNLWLGVAHAGYAFREELPIFLLIFALPVGLAVFVKWKFWSGVN